ncbi:MAG: glycosyltransferase family 4 protein [Candidatus Diapherotrites archaeon]
MKVLHISNRFWPCIGGVEKVVEQICLGLKKQGIQAEVLCLNKCGQGQKKLKDFETFKGIKIHRINFIELKYYKIAPQALNFVKDYDILHIHGLGFFLDFLVLTKYLHKKKIVLHTHGGIFHTKKIMTLKKFYFNFWVKQLLKKADRVIAVSKNDYDLFEKITRRKKMTLIENGIDFDFWAKTENKKHNGINFIFVGRISKNKQIDLLIKAISELKKLSPHTKFKLVIVGEDWGALKKGLTELRNQLGLEKEVKFLGGKTDKEIRKIYSEGDFLVSASAYEGFGLSVLEGMTAGLIPIVNNIGSFNYIIKNKKNGFIVDFKNPKETARKILRIIKIKNREAIKKKAKEKASHARWENKIKQLIDIYKLV